MGQFKPSKQEADSLYKLAMSSSSEDIKRIKCILMGNHLTMVPEISWQVLGRAQTTSNLEMFKINQFIRNNIIDNCSMLYIKLLYRIIDGNIKRPADITKEEYNKILNMSINRASIHVYVNILWRRLTKLKRDLEWELGIEYYPDFERLEKIVRAISLLNSYVRTYEQTKDIPF